MKTTIADGADPIWSGEAYARRKAILKVARGYFAETIEPDAASTNGPAMATGDVIAAPIGLIKGDLVAAMDVAVQTLAAGMTLWKIALADKTGTVLAVSADQSGAVTTTGKKPCPMLSAYRVLDDDFFQVLMLSVGTTGPALRCGNGQTASGFATARVGGFQPWNGRLSGQADLVVGTNYAITVSTSAQTAWAGLY